MRKARLKICGKWMSHNSIMYSCSWSSVVDYDVKFLYYLEEPCGPQGYSLCYLPVGVMSSTEVWASLDNMTAEYVAEWIYILNWNKRFCHQILPYHLMVRYSVNTNPLYFSGLKSVLNWESDTSRSVLLFVFFSNIYKGSAIKKSQQNIIKRYWWAQMITRNVS